VRQPKIRFLSFRFISILTLAASALMTAIIAIPARSSAGSVSTAVVAMFPKAVGEFAYADLKAARKLSWFPQIREQLLPSRFRQFEQFLASTGVDPNSQVDELAWGGITVGKDGEEVVGVALGNFDPSAVEARFKQQKTPSIEVHGYHLYAFGSGAGPSDILFFFLDSNTAAFGHRSALEKMIDVRFGSSESLLTNDDIFPLINEANGSGIIWAVLNRSYAHLAMQQLLPQVSQFPQAAQIIERMRAMVFSIEADSGVNAHIQAVCATTDDANLGAAAMQAGLMYRRYQEASTNQDLAKLLDGVHVQPAGDRLKIEVSVSEEQISGLIKSRVFAVPM